MHEKTKSNERNFPDCDEIKEDTPYHDRLYLDSDWMQEMFQCVVYAEGLDIKFKRQGHNMVITVVSEKLEAIQNWLLDEEFQSVRDNIPDHADYPRFGDFYSVYSDWVGEFWEWLERCPMYSVAILGEKEALNDE